MNVALSKNDIPIRLTDERWRHITNEHSELGGCYFDLLEIIKEPDAIYEGREGELIAVRRYDNLKWLIVVYKEIGTLDGFIITAYFTTRIQRIERRKLLWKP